MRLRRLILAFALIALGGTAQAQERPARRAAVDRLPAETRGRVVGPERRLAFRTRDDASGRVDVDAGVRRAAYRINTRIRAARTPEDAARAYLRAAAPEFGWPEDVADLVLISVAEGVRSHHAEFQQVLGGVPVYGRRVVVSLDRDLQPTMVLSGYAPGLRRVRDFSTRPLLSDEAARTLAAEAVAGGEARTGTPELVVFPGARPRLAWRVVAWPAEVAAEWEVLLDAGTGEIIQLSDLATHAWGREGAGAREEERGKGGEGGREYGTGESVDVRERARPLVYAEGVGGRRESALWQSLDQCPTHVGATVEGCGLVFDPDPLTSAGMPYGFPYSNQDDADVAELGAQRKAVPLRDLTFRDEHYYLEGPHVRVVGDKPAWPGAVGYVPPAEQAPDAFRYARSDPRFEAVMVYYHVDKSQRYVQSLGLGRPIQEGPIRVNPRAFTADVSFFFPTQNLIGLGVGGINDAEDAGVIWHEYAHALLESSRSGLVGHGEGTALHEGWADYWAASYLRGLIEQGMVPQADWRRIFRWDGNETWEGRTLDHAGRYPDCLDYAGPCDATASDYDKGLLWATTLMQVYDALGKAATDRLNLASHAYLVAPASLRDAAEALLQADTDYHDGAHLPTLRTILESRGFLVPGGTPAGQDEPRPVVTLHPNFPEPFSDNTTIRYTLDVPGRVLLNVYDLLGRRTLEVEDAFRPAGTHTVVIDASSLPGGTYLLRLETGSAHFVEPLTLIR